MVPEQCLFMWRLSVYFFIALMSFFCFLPLGVVLDDHHGYCLLYADRADYGPVAVCGYTITVPVIFSALYGGYMTVAYICKLTLYNTRGFIQETVIEFFFTVMMDGISWILMFVNACLISGGFNNMCWNIFDTIQKCSEGVLKHPVFGEDSKFYEHLKMAEVTAWLSWLLWFVQFIMGMIALYRSGVLPQGNAVSNLCCGALPCRPRCTCNLQFQRPHNHMAAQPDQRAAPIKKV